ncbi:MAG TPA: hypothetical protein VF423_10360 [Actinomycetes bacterium]
MRAPIADGRGGDLSRLLASIRRQGAGHNDVLPIGDLPGVHFARLFVLEETADLDGAELPACLFYMADVDGSAERHLRDLSTVTGHGVDALFEHCDGYPEAPTATARVAWLRDHQVAPAATYVHAVGRSVDQVHQEARLREAIEQFVDRPAAIPSQLTAVEAHGRIRAFATERDDLLWSVRPAPRPGLRFRVGEAIHRVALPLLVLCLLPVLVPVVLVAALRIRLAERRDVPETGPPAAEHAHELERHEDFVAQNSFTAVGFVKPGKLRRMTMRAVLIGLDYADRHVYNRDNLAGVRSIHFARWVPIDDGRRLVFCSSYDGTLESYMDEFIDRLAWGLNAVFSNGVGYPRTRWLLFGGARDETAFKNYLRRHQVANPVWYSAYDELPARNVDTNARLRADLARDLDEQGAEAWLAVV